MHQRVLVLIFCIIVMILVAGCTSPQSGAAAGSPIPEPGTRSLVTSAPTPGLLSSAFSSSKACWPLADMRRFSPIFPDMDGYRRDFNESSPGGLHAGRFDMIEEEYSGKFIVNLAIQDYSGCDVDATDLLKNVKAGDTENNFTVSSVDTGNYRGYPSTRVEIVNRNGEVCAVLQSIVINQKTLLTLGVSHLPSVYMVPNFSVSKSEIHAEADKFLNTMDFNGIAMAATAVTQDNKPISLTARYNPDGTIIVTSNGGPAVPDLSVIRVSVNKGKLRDRLDPQAGSTVTVNGIAGTKNHIIAVGTFINGTYQVLLETDVGPGP
jgi:hypothetical protein